MPKLKTIKSVAKRVKINKNGKVIIRHGGQGHFNSRDTGNQTRRKRVDKEIDKSLQNNIHKFLPYS